MAALQGLDFVGKRRLLAEHGVDLDALPGWQRQGVGLHHERWLEAGFPVRGREVQVTRRRVRLEEDLPAGDAYAQFLRGLLAAASA